MKSKLRKLVLAGAIGFTVATVAKRLQGGAGSDWQSTAGPDATIPPPPAPPVPPGPGPTPEPEPSPIPPAPTPEPVPPAPEPEPAPVSQAPTRPDPLTDPLPEVEGAEVRGDDAVGPTELTEESEEPAVERTAEVPVVPSEDKPAS